MFFLAFFPILLILALMIGARWRASQAGGAGYLAALLISFLWFQTPLTSLAYAHSKAVFLILDVLLIIWTAFLLFRVVDEAGGIEVLSQTLPRLTSDRGIQALLIGWVFASFLQGVGGFGVPTAVIAPILVGLGFGPALAVVIPSLGHTWAVTFGSLGASFNAMMAATDLGWEELAPESAVFLGITGILVGLAVAWTAGGRESLKRCWLPVLLIGSAMSGAQYFTATAGFWNIGGLAGGSAGLLAAVPLILVLKKDREGLSDFPWRRLLISVAGYGVLVVLTLLIQLIPGWNAALGVLRVGLEFPQTTAGGGFMIPAGPGRQLFPLRHAGMILLVSSLVSYGIFQAAGWYRPGAGRRILRSTGSRVMESSLGITSIVIMAVVMQHAGMTDTLARGFSSALGWFYPFLAPWLGALGAVMTGSNANSNLVFSALQLRTAEILGLPAALILASQTTGAALGSVAAPTKVIVGVITAGMEGREGEILRRLLPMVGYLILIISLLTFAGVYLL